MDTYDIIKTILLIIHGKITLNAILDLEANYYVFTPYMMHSLSLQVKLITETSR